MASRQPPALPRSRGRADGVQPGAAGANVARARPRGNAAASYAAAAAAGAAAAAAGAATTTSDDDRGSRTRPLLRLAVALPK